MAEKSEITKTPIKAKVEAKTIFSTSNFRFFLILGTLAFFGWVFLFGIFQIYFAKENSTFTIIAHFLFCQKQKISLL